MKRARGALTVATALLISAPSALADDVIRMATFNIRVFGQTKMSRPDVVETLAGIVRKYDVVAIQEIKDASESVPDEFLAVLGTGWAMSESPRTGLHESDRTAREQYVYYFNTETIALVGDGVLYDDAADSFQREPWLARFRTQDGTFTFVLANIHTRPAAAVEEIAALKNVLDWARLQWPDEDDFIVLGDYNASCDYASDDELNAMDIAGPDYLWIVPHDADTNLAGSRCAYDRIVATAGAKNDYAGFWDVDRAFASGDVSDHWPVWAAFYTGRDGN